MAKATEGFFSFNTAKVTNASHVVVFAGKIDADDDYLNRVLEQEDKDGRFAAEEHKAGAEGARRTFLNIHRDQLNDEQAWHEKQVYLSMGYLLLGVAALGIDAVPMEGVDVDILDQEFGFKEKGLRALAVVSLGYRTDSDFNAKLPKSRLPQDEIFTLI